MASNSLVPFFFNEKGGPEGPEKRRKKGPKIVTKNEGKKWTEKILIFYFLSQFHEYIVLTGMAPCADFLKFYNEFSRPKRPKNEGECGQNVRKALILEIFLLWAPPKMLIRDFECLKGTNLGPKTGPEASKIAVEK